MTWADRCTRGKNELVCTRPKGHKGECDLATTIRIPGLARSRARRVAAYVWADVPVPRWVFWCLVFNGLHYIWHDLLWLWG